MKQKITWNTQMLDEENIKTDWQNRGFSFGIWTDPPGCVWTDFSHAVDELFMLVTGKVEVIIDGHSIYPNLGEEILIPANQIHTVKNIGDITNRWYYGYKVT